MSLHLGILGSEQSPYVRQLFQAAKTEPQVVETRLLAYGDLAASIQIPAGSKGETTRILNPVDDLDAILVRSMPLGSLEQVIFRMDCLQHWEQAGKFIANPPKSLEVAIDKWLTLHRLHMAGVPVPPTVACQSRDAALEAFDALGGDVVAKPLFGGEGRGIVRVQDKDMAWRVFSTLQQMGSVMYVQKFLPHFGYDIRVLLVGRERFAIRRRAVDGAWKTNLSQGSSAELHTLTEQEYDLAIRSAQAVGGSVLGVDLLPCQDGRLYVLEVNAVPGWKGVSKATGVDVAQVVVRHVCESVTQQKSVVRR